MRRMGEERERDIFNFFFFSFLSQIYGNRIVDFYRSRMQSWFTRRELRVGTNILVFRQTSRGRKFPYLCYFKSKGYIMVWNILRSREMP